MRTDLNIRIGCSGWQYQHWRGDFYPAGLPQARWLEYYAERFDTVEINNTFYRLPEAPTFASWGTRAPRGFVYAVNKLENSGFAGAICADQTNFFRWVYLK